MIGYLVEQELGNRLPFEKPLASLLTMIEVDPEDPAFADPTKPIGPLYADVGGPPLDERGWTFKPDGERASRVPSPVPKRIFEHRPIRSLLDQGFDRHLRGRGRDSHRVRPRPKLIGSRPSSTRTACGLLPNVEADVLIIATDAPAVFAGLVTHGDTERSPPRQPGWLCLPSITR